MNRIVVEQAKIAFHDETVFIEKICGDTEVFIEGNTCVLVNGFDADSKIGIHLLKGSHLLLEFFVFMKDNHNHITIYNEEDTVLDFHYAGTYQGENELTIDSKIYASHVHNYIGVRLVENDGSVRVFATGALESNAENIFYTEDIKALTNSNHRVFIKPNLFVSSHEVIANHNATIGPVSEDEIFYLTSLGMDKMVAVQLLRNGFLKRILQMEELKGGESFE